MTERERTSVRFGMYCLDCLRGFHVVADLADLVPRARRWSDIEMRAIPVGLAHYASGVVAGDHVPDEQVEAMQTAVAAALERQRAEPATGLEQLRARCPLQLSSV